LAELMRCKLPSGATIIFCDDACKGMTKEEHQAAFDRFNQTVNECLSRSALNGTLKLPKQVSDQDLRRA